MSTWIKLVLTVVALLAPLVQTDTVAAGVLYSVDVANDQLVRVDPSNGAVQLVGALGFDVNDIDLAFHQGVLYGVNSVLSNRAEVFRIDIQSGAASPAVRLHVGASNVLNAEGLASVGGQLVVGFSSQDPSLYAHSNALGVVDPLTGNVANVSAFTFMTTDFDGLAADASGLAEFVSVDGATPASSTGQSVLFRTNRTPQQYAQVHAPYSFTANDLAFLDSALYAIDGGAAARLIELDATTGNVVRSRELQGSGRYLGLAVVSSVPEPALHGIWMGLAVAAICTAARRKE